VTEQQQERATGAVDLPLYLVGGVWLLSLGLMFWAAVSPAPDSWFYVALGAFIGCSLAWTALQLSQGRRVWGPIVLIVGLLLLVFGVSTLICNLWSLPWPWSPHQHPSSQWTVAAYACAYLGASYLVELLREQVDKHPRLLWAGIGLFFGGAALTLGIGIAFLLGAASGIAPLLTLGVSALVFLPIGLGIISERALVTLSPDNRKGEPGGGWRAWAWAHRRTLCAAGGLVLAGASVAVLSYQDHWAPIPLIVAPCLLVLVAALVSNTHADIAVILCVIALVGIAPVEVNVALADPFLPAGGPPSADLRAQSSDLLALGDSYMSGEGAKTFIKGTDEADGDACRRSPTAYAVLGVGPETPFAHVSFLACSGARTINVLPQPGPPHPCTPHESGPCPQSGESATQVDQVAALTSQLPHYKPKLVIVSLGGNDAGFSEIGDACIAPGDCTDQQNLFLGNLRLVQSDLLKTYKSIRAALPGVPVAVVPYPQPLYDAASCGSIALTRNERNFIRRFLASLDQVIEWDAEQAQFYYMGQMENALAGQHLQLCDPKNQDGPGINFVSPESVGGLPDQRFDPANWLHDSLHPNERGHQAMLDAFSAWLTQHPDPGWQAPGDPAAREPALPAATCTFDTANHPGPSCHDTLRSWEYSQILNLWPLALGALVGLIGLWMISVAALSGRPPLSHPKPLGQPAGTGVEGAR
jgi:lysophospholipase L1-like esterase